MSGSTCLQVKNTLLRLWAIWASQTSSLISARAARRRTAHVVDQHVDAPVPRQALADHGGNPIDLRHVTSGRRDLAAGLFDQANGFQHAPRVAVHREDARAFLSETHRDGAPVAPAGTHRPGAGDQCNLALKPSVHGRRRAHAANR